MSHRPVFQQIPMRVVRSDSMVAWLKDMFAGSSLKVSSDPLSNAVMLRGPIDLIRQASQAIELFDRPALKGSHSLAISPVYASADELGTALVKVLQAEGYDVSENPPLGGVVVLKLKELQRLIVFAADPAILATARQWVELLDRQSQEQVENGLFLYQVRNTQAAGIASMLGALGYSATIPDTGLNTSNTVTPPPAPPLAKAWPPADRSAASPAPARTPAPAPRPASPATPNRAAWWSTPTATPSSTKAAARNG
ncbi:secretin N-terminal domain-containing protein [Azotobacter vinelandii]